ncbi:MAG: DNA methyltransferase [Armatimonadota bacterium]|nr:DNA methyltransferase [Armatimonadota bacterium]
MHQTTRLTLHENVQFIYELVLAQMELEAAGVDFAVGDNLRGFRANGQLDRERLIRRSAYIRSLQPLHAEELLTDYHHIQQYNQTQSINQYLTHWFYPYKGKFHPQMIRALLGIIGLGPGDVVLDPFIGSGTTAVEAQLLGIDCIGVDISPLCCLISRVKTQSWERLDEIEEASEYVAPCSDNVHQQRLFRSAEDRELPEGPVRDFFDLAEMIARSDTSRRRRDPVQAFVHNRDKMLASVRDHLEVKRRLELDFGTVDIVEGDVREMELEDASVDGIVTSPPYSIALNYIKNDEHALEAMGFDLDELSEEFIGVRGRGKERFELYEEDMRQAAREMQRVMRPGAVAAVVIGNVTYQGEEIDTTGMFTDACEDTGLSLERSVDKIIFGLYNVMQKEYILLFRKQ